MSAHGRVDVWAWPLAPCVFPLQCASCHAAYSHASQRRREGAFRVCKAQRKELRARDESALTCLPHACVGGGIKLQAFLVLVCVVLVLLEGWAFQAYLGPQQDPGTAAGATPDSLGDAAGGAEGSGKAAGLLGAAKRTVAASHARAPQQADARLEAAELQVKTLLAQQLAAQEAHTAESAAAAARVAELTAALERSEGLVQRLTDEFSSLQCPAPGAAPHGPTAASGSVSSVREVKELGSRWGLLGSVGDVEEEPFDKCSWQVSALQYRCVCRAGGGRGWGASVLVSVPASAMSVGQS